MFDDPELMGFFSKTAQDAACETPANQQETDAKTLAPGKKVLTRIVPAQDMAALTDAGVDPVMARIYAARNIHDPRELEYRVAHLVPASRMKNLETAAERFADAILRHENICIVGDFDADGGTASALLSRFLFLLSGDPGAVLIPNRVTQGYGLSPELAGEARARGANLVITVDNGISALAGAKKVLDLGMDLIITDHHLPGDTLPDSRAILVNPNQPGCDFPAKSTCGVGVAFYLAATTLTRLLGRGWEKPEWKISSLLDLVALGTMADVVPLEYNNRIFVQAGIQRIRAGLACPGIRALLQVCKISEAMVTGKDLAFFVAPRINAAGRLQDMRIGIRLLTTDDEAEALRLAEKLHTINQERKDVEKDMVAAATEKAERWMQDGARHDLPKVLCLVDQDGHEGVVGLVAGRVRERYGRPALVFARNHDGSAFKGSARSVPGVHIRDLLAEVKARAPESILAFGGHAMAAGLTVPQSAFHAFQETLDRVALERITEEALADQLYSDGELPASHLGMDLAGRIEQGGPWGSAFPEPRFHGAFRVLSAARIGQDKNTLKLTLAHPEGPDQYAAIRFQQGDAADPAPGSICHVLYALSINRYRGAESLQMVIDAFIGDEQGQDSGAVEPTGSPFVDFVELDEFAECV